MKKLVLLVLLLASVNCLFGEGQIKEKFLSWNETSPSRPYNYTGSGPYDYVSGDNLGTFYTSNIHICGNLNVKKIKALSNPPSSHTYSYEWYIQYYKPEAPSYSDYTVFSSSSYIEIDESDFKYGSTKLNIGCKITKTAKSDGYVSNSYTSWISCHLHYSPKVYITDNYISFCPDYPNVGVPVLNATEKNVDVWLERKEGASFSKYEEAGVEDITSNWEAKLFIPHEDYIFKGVDYRFVYSEHPYSCEFPQPSLKEQGVRLVTAKKESYRDLYGSEKERSVCRGETTTLKLELRNKNVDYDYGYEWQEWDDIRNEWSLFVSDDDMCWNCDDYVLSSDEESLTLKVRGGTEKYRCVLKTICGEVISEEFTVHGKYPATIDSLIYSVDTACIGQEITVTARITKDTKYSDYDNELIWYSWEKNGDILWFGGLDFTSDSVLTYTVGSLNDVITCRAQSVFYCNSSAPDTKTKTVPVYEKLDVSIDTVIKSCGNAMVDLTANVTKGTGKYPYTYSWSSGETTKAITNKKANNTYTVTVEDACTNAGSDYAVTKSVTPNSLPLLTLKTASTNVLCNTQQNGSINAEIKGGVKPYEFTLFKNGAVLESDLEANAIYNNVALYSGDYIVEVKDACDTVKSIPITITQPEKLQTIISDYSDITCNQGGNGEATVKISGGTEPYNVRWTNGQNKENAVGLFAGSHICNVTDNNGCFSTTQVELTQPNKLAVTVNTQNVSCNGEATGTITVTAEGGSGNYKYSWDYDSKLSINKATELSAGTYEVTITDEGCSIGITKTITITEPDALTAEAEITNVSCFGQSDGSVELVATKGVSPYKYIWENAANTSSKTAGLKADTLSYKVVDACKDTIKSEAIVLQPDALKIETTVKDVSCNGNSDGSIEVSSKGGAAPYVYNWGGGIQSNKMQGLFAGMYKLTVLDVNACFQSLEIEVTEPTELEILSTVTEPECNSSNGSIDLTILGGTAPYTYKWSNDSVTEDLTNIVSDGYSVVVTDKNGCKQDAEFDVSTYVPTYNICVLTVDRDHGKNKVVWEKTHNTPITSVNVYRYYGGTYDYLGSTDSVEESYYDDMFSDPEVKMARYAITTEDACGNESELSPFHQTMHLAASKDVDGEKVNLIWTKYIDESGVFEPKWYYLYRGTSADNLVLFDSVDVGTQYSDTVPQGSKIYRVGVKKENPCITKGILKAESGPFSLAMSNIAESEQITTELNIADLEVKIYPNPSEGEFYVEGNFDDGYRYSVYSINGTEIASGFADSHGFVVDITNEPLGIYTLSITNGEETAVVNLVVQR